MERQGPRNHKRCQDVVYTRLETSCPERKEHIAEKRSLADYCYILVRVFVCSTCDGTEGASLSVGEVERSNIVRKRSRDSSVGIEMGNWLDCRGSIPGKGKKLFSFPLLYIVQNDSGAQLSFLSKGYRGLFLYLHPPHTFS
jgi:hypothetical protein